jgi:hypothetical protein
MSKQPLEPWDGRNFGGDKGHDWRRRWYHEDLSPETRRFLYAMPVDEYNDWANGLAITCALRRGELGFEDTLTPPLTLWQLECLDAMRAHDDADPIQIDYAAIEEEASNCPFQKTLLWLADLEVLSPESKKIFANMGLAKWRWWRPRYIALVRSAATGVVPSMHPGMRKCEREVFNALAVFGNEPPESPELG